MADNIITAYLHGQDPVSVPAVYWYNSGMILKFSGADLPAAYTVDFANNISGAAISQVGGPDVVYLQTLLCDVGETLTADGKFGSKTEQAVKDFQRLSGLTVDGVVGPKTWDALEKATAHEPDGDDPEAPEQPDTVTISRADWETICRIVHKYESVG